METNMNSSVRVAKDVKIKLNCFDGTNYTRWMDKMVFMFTSLKICYILDPNMPALSKSQEDEYVIVKTEILKCEEDEVPCQGYILNTLTNRLYDIFFKLRSLK
jgi:uncharacterized protein with NAD-binding domain and iron-sulfur cluster